MFRNFRYVVPFIPLLAVLLQAPARAESFTFTTTGASDYYFVYEQPSTVKVRTYAWDQYQIDSMLWLYDSNDNLIASNDDYFGLDSWIEIDVQPGTYRLRTGVCCHDPNRWYGTAYIVETTALPSNAPTSTTSSTSTSSTTSTVLSTTTSSSTTSLVTTTTEPETTTTVWETTSTTSTTQVPETLPIESTTTTWPEENPVAPATTTALPAVVATTVPVQTTTAPATSAPAVVQTTTPSSTIVSTTTDAPTTTSSTTSTTEVPESTPEEIEETQQEETIKEIFSEIDSIEDLSDEEVTQLIENIDSVELTDEQAEAIAEVLSSAPPEVKAQFEATVNVFSGQFANYVPNNSLVSVGTRRSLTATTASVAMVAAAPAPRRKQ